MKVYRLLRVTQIVGWTTGWEGDSPIVGEKVRRERRWTSAGATPSGDGRTGANDLSRRITMNTELLNTFPSEDGDAYTRRELLDAISEQRTTGTPLVRKFTFNRFNIVLDFETNQALLEDDLTVGSEGDYKIDLAEFERALQQHK